MDVPITFFCTLIYLLITFFMTNQPMELHRFMSFMSVLLLMCYAAQGVGIMACVGSMIFFIFSQIIAYHFLKSQQYSGNCNFRNTDSRSLLCLFVGTSIKRPHSKYFSSAFWLQFFWQCCERINSLDLRKPNKNPMRRWNFLSLSISKQSYWNDRSGSKYSACSNYSRGICNCD